jgi:hypothetical protein
VPINETKLEACSDLHRLKTAALFHVAVSFCTSRVQKADLRFDRAHLGHKVAHNTAIINAHSGAISVENTGNANLQT